VNNTNPAVNYITPPVFTFVNLCFAGDWILCSVVIERVWVAEKYLTIYNTSVCLKLNQPFFR